MTSTMKGLKMSWPEPSKQSKTKRPYKYNSSSAFDSFPTDSKKPLTSASDTELNKIATEYTLIYEREQMYIKLYLIEQ